MSGIGSAGEVDTGFFLLIFSQKINNSPAVATEAMVMRSPSIIEMKLRNPDLLAETGFEKGKWHVIGKFRKK